MTLIRIALSGLTGFLVCVNAQAVERTSKSLVSEINLTKKQLQVDELKERKVLSALYVINKKMKKVEGERGGLSRQQLLVEQAIAELNPKIEILEGELKGKKALLRERMRVIYKLGGQGLARILFSSKSSFELEKNLKVIGLIAGHDVKLIKDHNILLRDLENKKKKLDARLAHLKGLEGKIKDAEQELSDQNKSKQKLLSALRNSQLYNSKKIAEIRKRNTKNSNEEYVGLMDLLLRPSFVEFKGKLQPPVAGVINKKYGLESVPGHKFVKVNSRGVTYGTQVGATVNAIFDGTIAFVGEVPGHGKTLIIDHGDHYYTVYGNLVDVKVKDGEEIKKNTIIGKAGSPSEEIQGNLYFEIRHFSEPYDPTIWMRGTTL